MKKILLIIMGILFAIGGIAQTTITLQPGSSAGKDAYLTSLHPNQNYGTYPSIITCAWNSTGGNVNLATSLFQFNLSSIPSGAYITDARLNLYKDGNSTQEGHSGDNLAYLRRIVNSWSENTVTYNFQPMTTTLHQVTLPASKTADQDYLNINVTQLLNDMISDPAHSFGFYLQLVTMERPRSLVFASSDNFEAAKRPKLVITYVSGCDTVSGNLSYANGTSTPLQNFKVLLKNSSQTVVDSTFTNENGDFSFMVCLPDNYTVVPKGEKPDNGINASDALVVLKHFAGLINLEGLFLQAADVDRSGAINSVDAMTILNRFIGRNRVFLAGDWVFDTNEFTIPATGPINLNIKGLCIGDLNASWVQ